MWLLRGKVFVEFLKFRSDVIFCPAPVSTFTLCKMYVMVVDTGVLDRRCHKTDDEKNLSHTPMPLYPCGQRSRYYWIENYVRPRADLDVLWRGNSWPSREFSHNSWSSSPQPSHYTDYATPGTREVLLPQGKQQFWTNSVENNKSECNPALNGFW